MAKIMVLGSGGWGTALSVMANKQGHAVALWSVFEEEIAALTEKRENTRYLPGIKIPPDIVLTSRIHEGAGADMFILAVPSFSVRETAEKLKGIIPGDAVIVNVAKGLEKGSNLRLSQVIKNQLPNARVVVLSGPSHAEEVALGIPTTVVSAACCKKDAQFVQDILMNESLRIYTNDDMVGVELGGALKNVIALAAGVVDGLGLGDNTKAALITRGLTEIARLGTAMGAKRETFAGLTGIGDLIVTCTSMHSRNRRFGILIGEGVPAEEALKKVGMTVEGYHATATAWELSRQERVNMPITEECYRVLYENKSPKQAIRHLMERPKRHEDEITWL